MNNEVAENAKQMINVGSQSFAIAARLFKAQTYQYAIMLYAWCRYCDDQIDGQVLGHNQISPPPDEQRRRLDKLYQQTEAAMAGSPPDHQVFQGFSRVFLNCNIPKRYPLELLAGFDMDINPKPYITLNDTLTYSYHVAGVVGAMMACVMGVRDSTTLQRAVDLGLAFQMTNICRDVMQDAEDGRVYLPGLWLEEAGAPANPAEFKRATSALLTVAIRLLDTADIYYTSAQYGINQLPFRCAWAVQAAATIYRDIGRLIRARGAYAWNNRQFTSKTRKTWLSGISFLRAANAITTKHWRKPPPRQLLWSPPNAEGIRAEDEVAETKRVD